MRNATRSLLAFALLAWLAPLLHGQEQEVRIEVAKGVAAEDLIAAYNRSTGLAVLYPPQALAEKRVPAQIDVSLPAAHAHDLLVFALSTCELGARRYPSGTDGIQPLTVVLPPSSLVSEFRLTGLDLPIVLDRGPGSWRTEKDLAGSLAKTTVRALLETLATPQDPSDRTRAARLLGYLGPKTPEVAKSLARALVHDEATATAAWALARQGHAGRPHIADLKQAIQRGGAEHADALQRAIREIERSLHPSLLDPKLAKERAPERFTVRLETTKGEIDIEVTRDWSPLGADRFYNLCRIGFYDGAAFYRVIRKFVVQWGKHGDPRVSRAWYRATIPGEPPRKPNDYGYVTFAKTDDPHSRSTEVFINLGDNDNLNHPQKGFAPFGRVTRGMKVAERLCAKYGEQPQAGRIHYDGNRYLERNFPELDYIQRAVVLD